MRPKKLPKNVEFFFSIKKIVDEKTWPKFSLTKFFFMVVQKMPFLFTRSTVGQLSRVKFLSDSLPPFSQWLDNLLKKLLDSPRFRPQTTAIVKTPFHPFRRNVVPLNR